MIRRKTFLTGILRKTAGSVILAGCLSCVLAQTDYIPLSGVLPATVAKGSMPYLVTEYLKVKEGTSTTIERGVVFLFKNFTGIEVKGTLRVEGTEDEPVVFTSENDTTFNLSSTLEPAAFDWDGISLDTGESMHVFEHCVIQYSLFGIKSGTPLISLKKCYFKENGNADVTIGDQKLEVTSSPFSYATKPSSDNETTEEQETVEGQNLQTFQDEGESAANLETTPAREQREEKKPAVITSREKNLHAQKVARIIFRFAGVGAVLAGAAFGVVETRYYLNARDDFEKINSFDTQAQMIYTSEDWETAKDNTNTHLRNMFIGYGTGILGVMVFSISFAF